MTRLIPSVLTIAALALATGCADVRTGTVANAQEREAAFNLVAQLDAIGHLTHDARDSGSLLTATSYEGVVGLIAPSGIPVALLSRTAASLDRTCVSASGGAATFAGCTVAEHTVDGTVSASGSSVDAEIVDVFVVNDGVHGAVTIDAALTSSHDLIDGTIEVDFMWAAGSADHIMDARVRVEGVVLDDGGCPTGGTITVTGTVDDGPTTTVALAFGPTCGDVAVER